MPTPETGKDTTWRKSSRSNSSGDCVELRVIELPPADEHNEPR